MGQKKNADAEAPATPTLLWNERGMIGCTLPGHAPHKGTDTWKFEHWKKIPAGTLKEDGSAYACELCARGEPTAKPDEPAPVEESKPKKKTKSDVTLSDLAEKYLAHMERQGKSNGTCFSYKLELALALGELGSDTLIKDLTPENVMLFFGCDRVQKKRSGKQKSPLSIAKSQRVLRLALVWAEKAKLIESAPLPEKIATH